MQSISFRRSWHPVRCNAASQSGDKAHAGNGSRAAIALGPSYCPGSPSEPTYGWSIRSSATGHEQTGKPVFTGMCTAGQEADVEILALSGLDYSLKVPVILSPDNVTKVPVLRHARRAASHREAMLGWALFFIRHESAR